MSKDIWHTSKEKPEQLRYYLEEYDKFSDGIGYLVNKRYGVVDTIDDLTTKRWCYLDDLLALETDLDRTRKALEIIKKEMSKETMPDFAVIHNALKTALEQKDVK